MVINVPPREGRY
jgi:hypothetical protein